jgi:hypothetical protein
LVDDIDHVVWLFEHFDEALGGEHLLQLHDADVEVVPEIHDGDRWVVLTAVGLDERCLDEHVQQGGVVVEWLIAVRVFPIDISQPLEETLLVLVVRVLDVELHLLTLHAVRVEHFDLDVRKRS